MPAGEPAVDALVPESREASVVTGAPPPEAPAQASAEVAAPPIAAEADARAPTASASTGIDDGRLEPMELPEDAVMGPVAAQPDAAPTPWSEPVPDWQVPAPGPSQDELSGWAFAPTTRPPPEPADPIDWAPPSPSVAANVVSLAPEPDAGFVAPEGPLAIAGEHRVAIYLRDGGTRRGVVRDLDLGADQFSFLPQGEARAATVEASGVKAVFFMLAPGEKAPAAPGGHVRVTFQDGRVVEGSRDGADDPKGFFLVPSDAARTNTRRIFVVRAAVRDVRDG